MFTEEQWINWSQKEEGNYKLTTKKDKLKVQKYLKKGYLHFDLRFWFPERKLELKSILQNKLRVFHPVHKRKEWHAFMPFLKISIKTPRYKYQDETEEYDLTTKVRPICFASHIDSLILSFYSFCINQKYEEYITTEGLNDNILAYRSNLSGKCNIQFSKEVFDDIRKKGECTAIALDIKGYFDHINHNILKEKWKKILNEKHLPEDQFKIYKAITEYSYVNKNNLLKKNKINLSKLKNKPKTILELVNGKNSHEKFQQLRKDNLIVSNNKPNKKTNSLIGIPQGSAISALMSNIYLIDFDKILLEKSKSEDFLYRRYCDDILVVCKSEDAIELQEQIIKLIANYGLTIQPEKVELIEFKKNSKGVIRGFDKKKILNDDILILNKSEQEYYKSLQYLGFEFNGENIFVRASSLSRYFRKMKARIRKTVSMAYSKNSNSNKIWKEQLFHRYTHLGKRNFFKYALNASKEKYSNANGEIKEGMNSKAIQKQLRRHFNILIKNLETKNSDKFDLKAKKGKAKTMKEI